MPDSKITALASIGTGTDPANDPLVIVDVSDTSMAATGTTKKVSLNNLLACSPTATLASATITGDLTVRTTGLVVNSTGTGVQVSPSAPLCVKTRNSDSVGLRVLQSTGGTAGIQFTDDPVTADWGSILATSANLFLRSNSLLQLQTGGATERFAISSTGVCTWSNVGGVAGTAMTLNSTGLGVGASPVEKLTVAGAAEITGGIVGQGCYLLRDGSSGGGTYSAKTGNVSLSAPASGTLRFNVNGGTLAAQIDTSGNVGVGVTPSYRIHAAVASGSNQNIARFQVTGASNGLTITWNNTTSKMIVNFSNLPTSSAGLASGDLWIDTTAGNTLKVA